VPDAPGDRGSGPESAGADPIADARSAYFDAAPDALITFEPDGTVVDLNRAAEATFGYPPANAVGRRIEELIIPRALREAFRARLERFGESGNAAHLASEETRFLRANGQDFPAELTLAPVRSGGALRFVAQVRDISRRRQEENHMRRAVEFNDELLGMVSHELRGPLAVVKGNAVLLAHSITVAGGDDGRSLAELEEHAARAERVVENMLALGRAASIQRIATEPVSLRHALREAVSLFQQSRPAREISLVVDDDLPPVLAEPTFLGQIVENLLTNADKYSPADRPVLLTAKRRGPMAEVTVRDEGEGLSREDIQHLFDAYFRAGTTAARAPGSGLGLTVCKRLTEALGGRIAARPAEPRGLCVVFSLPLAPAAEE
jgi:PAS domain S-box-containing protein